MTNEVRLNTQLIGNYEEAKKHLFIRVRNVKNYLQPGIVYTEIKDLAITYHIAISEEESGIASVLVTYELLKHFGIDKEQLHKDALKSAKDLYPVRIGPLMGMVEQSTEPSELTEELIPDDPVLVLTNTVNTHGAAAIFYPDVMETLGRALGDYFILPSSIHEVLILKDDGLFGYEDLEAMVQSVNRFEVSEAEQLSDVVYHYEAESGRFESAADFAKRTRTKKGCVSAWT